MGLSFAHGAVQWLAASAVSTNYVVTGLGFEPKALRFYWNGLASASDAASAATHARRGVGFARSPSARACVDTIDQDNAGVSVCTTSSRSDAIAATVSGTATDGLLDLTAIGTDGFTLTVDDQAPVDLTVFWEAWGGSDITNVSLAFISEPAATGDQDYTAAGFAAGAADQVVMFAGVHQSGATARGNSGLSIGMATGPGSAQAVAAFGATDAVTTMDTSCYARTGECVAQCTTSGAGGATARASLVSFGTDTFRLNWAARAVTGRNVIYLAIKGGGWEAGAVTLNGATVGNTVTKTGLLFTPVGLSVVSTANPEATSAGLASAGAIGSIGTGTGASARRAQGTTSQHGIATSAIELTLQYDQILAGQFNSTLAQTDLSALTSDGFTLIHDGPGALPTAHWIGYLAFGTLVTTPQGFGSAAFTVGATGAGASVRRGTGTAAFTLGATGTGRTVKAGSAISAFTLARTGAGVSPRRGSGTAALALSSTGQGVRPALSVPQGFGAAALALVPTGRGTTPRRGTGATALVLASVGVGQAPALPVLSGDGVAALVLEATGTGDRLSWGRGEALLTLLALGEGRGEFISMVNVRMTLSKPGLQGTVLHLGPRAAVERVGGIVATVEPVMETEED